MGTSASGSGANGSNPLIPSWIDDPEGLAPALLPQPEAPIPNLPRPDQPPPNNHNDGIGDTGNAGNEDQDNADNNTDGASYNFGRPMVPQDKADGTEAARRYTGPRREFNNYIRSKGNNSQALKNALKGYSRNAAGGTGQLAQRMRPSASRVARFHDVINTVREQGAQQVLRQFNLDSYQDKPLLDILSALSDVIFADTGRIYEDTQDDSITKQAYANTVERICETDGIDFDSLATEQVEAMVAIFIEETIAQRVINDIGNNMTQNMTDMAELVEMEENIYQIVNGLVRTKIMPEIIATQRGDRQNLEAKIENIYRIAFDAMAGQNE